VGDTSKGQGSVVTDLLAAVADEVEAANAPEQRWQVLEDAVLRQAGDSRVVLKATDLDARIQEGASAKVRLDGVEFAAEVTSLELGVITLMVNDCETTAVTQCEVLLPREGWTESLHEFLENSREKLEEASAQPGSPICALVNPSAGWVSAQRPLTYVVGAPGSGKTTDLVQLALAKAHQGKRVAIVTYTNAAADVIFERLAPGIDPEADVTLCRMGATERSLGIENMHGCETVGVTSGVRDSLEASIMITTAYRALACATVSDGTHDVVFIDEASTMPLSLTCVVAMLARSQVRLYGDPYQLGPIALSEAAPETPLMRRFATSPFELLNFENPLPSSGAVSVMNGQYRLAPSLASATLPPLYAQGGVTSTGAREPESPWGAGSLLYVDTTSLNAASVRTLGSRQNEVHASGVVESVRVLLEQGAVTPENIDESLLVITPYRAQRLLISQMLQGTGWFSDQQIRSLVTTIHRSQGSERDFVLVDTTDALSEVELSQQSVGRLWQGTGLQSDGSRLLTTALTRARVQALVVMRRDVTGTAQDPFSEGARALARLNALLDRWGNPAAFSLEDADSSWRADQLN